AAPGFPVDLGAARGDALVSALIEDDVAFGGHIAGDAVEGDVIGLQAYLARRRVDVAFIDEQVAGLRLRVGNDLDRITKLGADLRSRRLVSRLRRRGFAGGLLLTFAPLALALLLALLIVLVGLTLRRVLIVNYLTNHPGAGPCVDGQSRRRAKRGEQQSTQR